MKSSFIIIFFLIFSPNTLWARVYKVQKNTVISSVQQAINLAQNGDTVLVEPGIYKEKNIVVNKSIVLIGNKYPVLDGEHTYEIISVRANNITIKGFKLIHSGISSLIDIAGIKIYSREGVTIVDNLLEDTFFGIYLQKSVNCLIENNKLTAYATTDQQSGNGIHCWQSDSLRIIGNTI